MFRILVAECQQEVSSFNPVPSDYGDFAIRRGAEFFGYHSVATEEVGGALRAFASGLACEPVPTYSAKAITSGGTLRRDDYERIAGEFLDALRRSLPADGVYLALHGAMSAEGQSDPEGHLIAEARKIVGGRVPIVVSLDLHAVLTTRMLRNSDAVVAYHTYPHVDHWDTGERAARLLTGILEGNARPVTARVKIPMLVRGDELITETGSFGRVVRIAQEFEQCRRGLSSAVIIGNPFTDVPGLRSNSLAVSDGDRDVAARCATNLASEMWRRRRAMQAALTGVREAVRLAGETQGTAVLMDAADATSSGASGDSNAVLREAVESGFPGSVLTAIVDPRAVRDAFEAGVGRAVRTTVGGALDTVRFRPLAIEATVKLLSDGELISESFCRRWSAGPTAVLESERRVIVVTTRAVNLFDRSLFLANGQDPKRFDLVVVKSPHCEPHMYQEWCGRLINVDGPGSTSANLASLGHSQCARPVFPLDPQVEFRPEVEVFERNA